MLSNKEDDRVHERKYLGTVLNIGEFKYFVPLCSPKESDFILFEGKKVIRKDIVPIMRIVIKNNSGEDELKGTLKFSNMIPVPDSALITYDVTNETDKNYKILVLKQISFIRKNAHKIIRNAEVIYKQKVNNYNFNYLKSTVNFPLLELKCKEYDIVIKSAETTLQENEEKKNA